MTTQISAAPWYDDFDPANDYHQILFKPSYAVQARELTQLQSILRDQIAKFGSHIFKHGSVVIPGNTTTDLTICYVKVIPSAYKVVDYVGQTIVGSSGLKAIIRAGIAATTGDPDTLYVSYYNTGTAGESVFSAAETLSIAGSSAYFVAGAGTPTGGAAMAFINTGVFFINGSFVNVAKQSVVIGKYTNTPSCSVLLQINESIIDVSSDNSLYDPAQGSNNYAAPGADRIKITLTLTSLALSDTITASKLRAISAVTLSGGS